MRIIDLRNIRDVLIVGVATGLIGIGLQNYNPFEPRDCTHLCSISTGLLFILFLVLFNVVKLFFLKVRP